MRKFRKYTVWLRACFVAVSLLFAQFVLAAQACLLPTMAPAMVFSSAPCDQPCDDMSGNACLMQFLQGDQALDSAAGFAVAPVRSLLMVVSSVSSAASRPHSVSFTPALGPPLRSRLCRLLI